MFLLSSYTRDWKRKPQKKITHIQQQDGTGIIDPSEIKNEIVNSFQTNLQNDIPANELEELDMVLRELDIEPMSSQNYHFFPNHSLKLKYRKLCLAYVSASRLVWMGSPQIFQQHWDIVGKDVIRGVQHFSYTGNMLKLGIKLCVWRDNTLIFHELICYINQKKQNSNTCHKNWHE